ncbi:hypothetical protein [Sandaracinus amylolyticus]|uniref:hypothetical protein n=1 Tax=Sandaracinus amylolyticus TaxID=927083 RepID=UPI001F22CD26|nr:hypothetical protein [Sandaracinus amylolyticus]
MRAVDTSAQVVRWETPLPEGSEPTPRLVRDHVLALDLTWFGPSSGYGTIVLDLRTGAVLASNRYATPPWAKITTDDLLLEVVDPPARLVATRLGDGHLAWTRSVRAPRSASFVRQSDGAIGLETSDAYQLVAADGSLTRVTPEDATSACEVGGLLIAHAGDELRVRETVGGTWRTVATPGPSARVRSCTYDENVTAVLVAASGVPQLEGAPPLRTISAQEVARRSVVYFLGASRDVVWAIESGPIAFTSIHTRADRRYSAFLHEAEVILDHTTRTATIVRD